MYPLGAMYSRLAAAAFPSRSKTYNDATERKLVVAEAVWGGGMCSAVLMFLHNMYLLHTGTWGGFGWWVKWTLTIDLLPFIPFLLWAAARFRRDITDPDHQERAMLHDVTDTFMDLLVGAQAEMGEPVSQGVQQDPHMNLGCTIEWFYTKVLLMVEAYYREGVSWSQREWVSQRAVFTRKQWELAISTLRGRKIIIGEGHGTMAFATLEEAVSAFWLTPAKRYVVTQQGLLGV